MFNSTKLFCVIDDFFLKFEATYWEFLKQNRGSLRIRTAQLTISEICFIAIGTNALISIISKPFLLD